jgi:hypothetical protein
MAEVKKRAHGAVWREVDATLVEWDAVGTRVTRPWPKPRCWTHSTAPGAGWVEGYGRLHHEVWTPELRWRGPATDARRRAAAAVPEQVRNAVSAAALVSQEWQVLSMVARVPMSLELVASVPALAGMLAACRSLGRTVQRPLRTIRALLRTPDGMVRWRKILRWLGFPDTRAFVNVLRAVPTGANLNTQSVLSLRDLWGHPQARKRLLHAPRLSVDAISLIQAAHAEGVLDRLHPELIAAAAIEASWSGLPDRFVDCARYWRALYPRRPLPSFHTIEEVEATLPTLVTAYRVARGDATTRAFPPPPLPSPPEIVPLASPEALTAEGARMGHCLGLTGWEHSARLGLGYAYAVCHEGERATLWLRRDRSCDLGFRLEQLRGPYNAAPSPRVADLVARWLVDLSEAPPVLADVWVEGVVDELPWEEEIPF